jgi:SEC-C motif-containing protein
LHKTNLPNCPCDSGELYQACCEAFHLGSFAPSAEALMRSRYSAYVLRLEDYLLQTWHPNTRPKCLSLHQDIYTKWLGLKIIQAQNQSETESTVEFIARYRTDGGKAERIHEVSQFELLDRWYYHIGIHH